MAECFRVSAPSHPRGVSGCRQVILRTLGRGARGADGHLAEGQHGLRGCQNLRGDLGWKNGAAAQGRRNAGLYGEFKGKSLCPAQKPIIAATPGPAFLLDALGDGTVRVTFWGEEGGKGKELRGEAVTS